MRFFGFQSPSQIHPTDSQIGYTKVWKLSHGNWDLSHQTGALGIGTFGVSPPGTVILYSEDLVIKPFLGDWSDAATLRYVAQVTNINIVFVLALMYCVVAPIMMPACKLT